MTVRNEIKEVVLRAACRVLENTGGDLSKNETKRLHAIIEARIPLYTNRYPILGLLDQIESTADAGHAAAVATNARNKQATRGAKPGLGREARQIPHTHQRPMAPRHPRERGRSYPRALPTTRPSSSSKASARRPPSISAAA